MLGQLGGNERQFLKKCKSFWGRFGKLFSIKLELSLALLLSLPSYDRLVSNTFYPASESFPNIIYRHYNGQTLLQN